MEEEKVTTINPDDAEIWSHLYRVHLHEFDIDGLLAYANCEQDALDYAIDYAEENGWNGLFADPDNYTKEEWERLTEYGEITFAGNHCLPIYLPHLRIIKVK